MKTQRTPAERAYTEFAAEPLAQLAGVDRASFIAGYETASWQNARLVEALQKVATCSRYVSDAGTDSAFALESLRAIASALLAEIAQEGKS